MYQIKPNTAIKADQPLVDLVIESVAITKRSFAEAKQPNFTLDKWAPLAAMVAINEFIWVSPHFEELSWQQYISYLTEWARAISWESKFRRIHQWQNLVFLEHEERSVFGDTLDVGRSVSVYEFNTANKIQRLSVYLQHKPSLGL